MRWKQDSNPRSDFARLEAFGTEEHGKEHTGVHELVALCARVIFYSADADFVYLMTIYAKNRQIDISSKELKIIKEY